MVTAMAYFLGIAGFIVAALTCLSLGRRSGRHIEVDLPVLRTAAVCFLSGCRAADRGHAAAADNQDETAQENLTKWREMKTLWLQWYVHCQDRAMLKRKTLLSWARTMVVCALLCMLGIYIEVHFDEQISLNGIFNGLLQ